MSNHPSQAQLPKSTMGQMTATDNYLRSVAPTAHSFSTVFAQATAAAPSTFVIVPGDQNDTDIETDQS